MKLLTMNLQPTLESELVMIRPLKKEDFEPLFDVAKDPKIWEQHPCKRYLREEFEKFFYQSMESKGALAILDKATKKMIGSSRYKVINGFSNGIEIGWTFINREHWGGKYNLAIKKMMMEHVFAHVENVIFYVDKNNFRSQKAVEKIGGQKASESESKKLPKTDSNTITYIVKKSIP